jgi:phospholipid N-methyltransferase
MSKNRKGKIKMTDITYLTTTEGNDQFYPTLPELAAKMLEGINWKTVQTVLESSAGKGNLVLKTQLDERKMQNDN